MARPQQKILLTHNDEDYFVDIISSEGLWVIVYKSQPINLRRKFWILNGTTHKYMKTAYPNHAHAYRTAAKLNKIFNTDEFTVVKVL